MNKVRNQNDSVWEKRLIILHDSVHFYSEHLYAMVELIVRKNNFVLILIDFAAIVVHIIYRVQPFDVYLFTRFFFLLSRCRHTYIHTISSLFFLKCAHTYTIKFIRVQFTLSHILLFESQQKKMTFF